MVAEIFHSVGRQGLGLQGDRRPPQPARRPALPQPRRPGAQPPRRLGRAHDPRDAAEPHLHRPHWSGTGSTSPPNARPAAAPACAPEEEWVVSEATHLPLVSDELFAAAQAALRRAQPRQRARATQAAYLFAGMVRCCSGHQPLAMYGTRAQGHTYYDLRLRPQPTARPPPTRGPRPSGSPSARTRCCRWSSASSPSGSSARCASRSSPSSCAPTSTRSQARRRQARRQPAAPAGRRARRQDQGRRSRRSRQGIEPRAGLRADRELRGSQGSRSKIGAGRDSAPTRQEAEDEELPSSSRASRTWPARCARRPPQAQAPGLRGLRASRSPTTRPSRRIEISATISEAVADALENAKALPEEGSSVVVRDIAGAGFEPTTSGL